MDISNVLDSVIGAVGLGTGRCIYHPEKIVNFGANLRDFRDVRLHRLDVFMD